MFRGYPFYTQDAGTEAAPLFGRGDHTAQEKALTVRDKCDLIMRASFLITVFLPFLLLGPFLLLLANQFAPSVPAQAQAATMGAGSSAQSASHQQVNACACLPPCLSVCVCLFCLPACLPVCLSVSACLPVSVCLSVCPSVRLSVCLCLPACLPVCLSGLAAPKAPSSGCGQWGWGPSCALQPSWFNQSHSPSSMFQLYNCLQGAPAQKNLGNATELDAVMAPQDTPSRVEGVGVASQLRTAAFKLLLMGCRNSGAAFIKWGQWSSTREDIFPAVCSDTSLLTLCCFRAAPVCA